MYCSIQYIINTYIVLNMIGLCGCVVVQKTGFPAHTWYVDTQMAHKVLYKPVAQYGCK